MGLRERLEGSCTVPAPVLDARPKSAPVIADTDVGDLNASDVPEKRRVMLPAETVMPHFQQPQTVPHKFPFQPSLPMN